MKVLIWHVHGSWTTSFVQGPHRYLVPVLPDRGPDGRGLARTFSWPVADAGPDGRGVRELAPAQLTGQPPDVVVLQRPHELELTQCWTGLRPGLDLPAVYLEHNTPRGDAAGWRHPLADRADIPIVHVTEFNAAVWDSGRAPVRVIEHGIPDPGYRWSGARASLAVCVNEPVRRWRVAGLDVAARIAADVPIEVYGMALAGLPARIRCGLAGLHEDLPQAQLHQRLGTHRAYLHPYRWTSLGLALIEAMALGLPVLALAATAAPQAIPPDAGLVSPDPAELARFAARLRTDSALARELGLAARQHALARFGLCRFIESWNALLAEVTR